MESPVRVVMLEEMTSQRMVPQKATTDSQDFWSSDSVVIISSLWLSATKRCVGESAYARTDIANPDRGIDPASPDTRMARDMDTVLAFFAARRRKC